MATINIHHPKHGGAVCDTEQLPAMISEGWAEAKEKAETRAEKAAREKAEKAAADKLAAEAKEKADKEKGGAGDK